MKSFLMKFDESGNPTFVDEKDRAAYGRLLSSISNRYGLESARFVMQIQIPKTKDINNNQINLFRVLVSIIRDETGNDYHTIFNTLIEKHFGSLIEIDTISSKEFSDFFESTLQFSQEFFGLNLTYNEETKQIEIIK